MIIRTLVLGLTYGHDNRKIGTPNKLTMVLKIIHETRSAKYIRYACAWSVVLFGYSASSTTKTGRHDIAEILLKVALNTKNQSINQSIILSLNNNVDI
jgi:hypothetical protein